MSGSTFMLWNLFNLISTNKQPNIILILADDLGWNDVGWHNHDIKTPNLNTLAYEGIILNQTYVTPVCSPSRASLLTGRYSFKLGMQHGILKSTKPQGLPLKETLLPQKLKELGYSTHMVGKWHLGFCNWAYTPTYRGFNTFYGFYTGQQDYYTHRGGRRAEKGFDFRYNTKIYHPKKKRYSTTDFGRRAMDIIAHHDKSRPLFLYLPFQAVHVPLQVPKRFEYTYAHVRNKPRRVFSAMVTALDEAVGNIVKSLMKKQMLDNTLILFLSDNGGAPYQGSNNWPLRGGKGTLWEGGTRVPGFLWGNMLNHTGYVNNDLIHVTDWFPTLLSAAGGKPDTYKLDGIDHWDSLRKGLPGSREEFVYSINEISGRAAIRKGRYKLIIGSPGHYSGWYKPHNRRGKNVKLKDLKIKLHQRGRKIKLLFDLENDPREKHDISKHHPDIVKELKSLLMKKYWSKLVPSNNPRKLKKAHPKFWDGVWSPGWC